MPELHEKRLKSLRYSNSKGEVIPMHHAFLTLSLERRTRMIAMLLPFVFLFLMWWGLPLVTVLWGDIFHFWMSRIYTDGDIAYEQIRVLGRLVYMPYPLMEADDPSVSMVYWNMGICVVLFLLSFLIPKVMAPVTYLTRAALLIQASASLDRMLAPDDFPYTLKIYMLDTLSLNIYLVFLLPVVLGFVYYIFDFSAGRKIMLTVLMLVYFFITIPCQYMLHAVAIHEWTLLFLPIMYLLFGTLLDVLMFISIYAVGMSWQSKETAMQGRGL